MGGKISS
eukprot:gene16371-7772_t